MRSDAATLASDRDEEVEAGADGGGQTEVESRVTVADDIQRGAAIAVVATAATTTAALNGAHLPPLAATTQHCRQVSTMVHEPLQPRTAPYCHPAPSSSAVCPLDFSTVTPLIISISYGFCGALKGIVLAKPILHSQHPTQSVHQPTLTIPHQSGRILFLSCCCEIRCLVRSDVLAAASYVQSSPDRALARRRRSRWFLARCEPDCGTPSPPTRCIAARDPCSLGRHHCSAFSRCCSTSLPARAAVST